MTFEKGTLLRLRLQPTAAGHIVDVLILKHTAFPFPYDGCQIASRTTSRQEPTLLACCGEVSATQRQMTDGCSRPDVVHGPDDGFAAPQYLPDILEREHALIDPVQVDDIGFFELPETGDVCAGVGDIHLEEMLPREMQTAENDKPLPKEMPSQQGRTRQLCHRQTIRLLITHQHLSLDTVVVQRLHQTAGSYSGTTRSLTRVYNQYSHPLIAVTKVQQVLLITRKKWQKVCVIAHKALIYVKNEGILYTYYAIMLARKKKSSYLCIVKRLIDCFRLVVIFIVLGF